MGYLRPPIPLDESASAPAVDTTQSPAPTPAPDTAAPTSKYLRPSLPADLTPTETAAAQPSHGYLWNAARTFGDQAIAPHFLDRVLASGPGGSGDVNKEAAISQKAEDALGISGSIGPKTAGQYFSIANAARYLPWGVGAAASTPPVQGVLTGGLGTVLMGDFNPADIALNSGASAAAAYGGNIVGKYGADILKGFAGSSSASLAKDAQQAVDEAFLANSPSWGQKIADQIGVTHLNELHDLYKRGGDVASRAEELAGQYTGKTADAYRNIAKYVNQSTDPGILSSLAGFAAAHTNAGAAAYPVVQKGVQYLNAKARDIDIRGAIDRSYPVVSNFVKRSIDPQAWGRRIENAALGNASSLYHGGLNLVKNYGF
jgi:hypothetical protein